MPPSKSTDPAVLAARTIMLTDAEREVAAILAFDPDATIPPGALHAYADEPQIHPYPEAMMTAAAWRKLARACADPAQSADDAALVRFLAERRARSAASPADRIGARVRIARRPRTGGDRYAGREGVIVKTHFAGFYVKLDMTPRERTQKTELVETEYLEFLAAPARPSLPHRGERHDVPA